MKEFGVRLKTTIKSDNGEEAYKKIEKIFKHIGLWLEIEDVDELVPLPEDLKESTKEKGGN